MGFSRDPKAQLASGPISIGSAAARPEKPSDWRGRNKLETTKKVRAPWNSFWALAGGCGHFKLRKVIARRLRPRAVSENAYCHDGHAQK